MRKSKYDNTLVILVLDAAQSPKVCIGYVKKMVFKNVKGCCKSNWEMTSNYREALKFKYDATVEIMIGHLIGSANSQWDKENLQLIPRTYKQVRSLENESNNDKH